MFIPVFSHTLGNILIKRIRTRIKAIKMEIEEETKMEDSEMWKEIIFLPVSKCHMPLVEPLSADQGPMILCLFHPF